LHVFLNFDFLKIESLRHYKLAKSDEYITSKKILKDMELIIDENLLKKNNRILIDFNAFFPNGLALQRYVTINYFSETSNLEVIKKNNIEYAYIVLNKNLKDLKFQGYEIEKKNREILSTTGFFTENQKYTLIYSNYNIELYERNEF
jgi:biotin operon repressor